MKKEIKRNIRPFIKYCVVGLLGTTIDIGGLFILVDIYSFPVLPAATITFLLATINNFILNKNWTFRNGSENYKKLYIKFLLVSVAGLIITLLSMHFLVYVLLIWYILAKAITSALVLVWNFLVNKLWTFRMRKMADIKEGDLKLSVIIPAYNEENRIAKTLEIVYEYFKKKEISFEIIVIDDGSSDNTFSVVSSHFTRMPNLKYEKLPKNMGKGAAVKRGVEIARGSYILFSDADNSTPIDQYEKLDAEMINGGYDIVIGSRYVKSSNIRVRQPKMRILLGRIGNKLIQFFLLEGINDTQCGFKLFKSSVAKDIFSFQKVYRFGFDMEILVIARNLGCSISELGVDWLDVGGSRLRPLKDSIITFKDLFYIKANLWSGRYDRD